MLQNNHIIVPTAIGLIVGIAFIFLFAMVFNEQVTGLPAKRVSVITIPKDASLYQDPAEAFEPQEIKVVIGVNNTVRWVNQDLAPARIEADDDSDPNFRDATRNNTLIPPEGFFEYTFTNPGEFGYHGQPWQRGVVIVRSSSEP